MYVIPSLQFHLPLLHFLASKHLPAPLPTDPQVYIFLPRLANLRTVTEHMKPLSDLMGVSANRNGGFKLQIQTEDVALETSWSGCDNPAMECMYISRFLRFVPILQVFDCVF